ncbi:hypothetical protein HMPREF9446_01669 [Bacteroides fluxus YIT 12057]|uniref:Uncharacterized protein n=1 Tax=Bacteroides fluxus YIT 12057 TaxID=763034 RepID=F3PSD5_9BACE|nr:hypothetical protein HMPREF9446_01669 [Bacteroides fluxus YIT 12057]
MRYFFFTDMKKESHICAQSQTADAKIMKNRCSGNEKPIFCG